MSSLTAGVANVRGWLWGDLRPEHEAAGEDFRSVELVGVEHGWRAREAHQVRVRRPRYRQRVCRRASEPPAVPAWSTLTTLTAMSRSALPSLPSLSQHCQHCQRERPRWITRWRDHAQRAMLRTRTRERKSAKAGRRRLKPGQTWGTFACHLSPHQLAPVPFRCLYPQCPLPCVCMRMCLPLSLHRDARSRGLSLPLSLSPSLAFHSLSSLPVCRAQTYRAVLELPKRDVRARHSYPHAR